jgi:hypothetical protein
MSEASSRRERLLARLEAINQDVIQTCEKCTDEQWQKTLVQDGRPPGVVFHHIALSYSIVAQWAAQIANGETLPELTEETVDAYNDAHAVEAAGITKAEVIAALNKHATRAAELLRPLTDAQLGQRSAVPVLGFPGLKAGSLFNAAAIAHAEGHLHSIKSELGFE